jgi:hypothetical protein
LKQGMQNISSQKFRKLFTLNKIIRHKLNRVHK